MFAKTEPASPTAEERQALIDKADHGNAGLGKVVASNFMLMDAIKSLDRTSTKLQIVMLLLTVFIALLTAVMTWDVLAKHFGN
jgi:hypothetical protein